MNTIKRFPLKQPVCRAANAVTSAARDGRVFACCFKGKGKTLRLICSEQKPKTARGPSKAEQKRRMLAVEESLQRRSSWEGPPASAFLGAGRRKARKARRRR